MSQTSEEAVDKPLRCALKLAVNKPLRCPLKLVHGSSGDWYSMAQGALLLGGLAIKTTSILGSRLSNLDVFV